MFHIRFPTLFTARRNQQLIFSSLANLIYFQNKEAEDRHDATLQPTARYKGSLENDVRTRL